MAGTTTSRCSTVCHLLEEPLNCCLLREPFDCCLSKEPFYGGGQFAEDGRRHGDRVPGGRDRPGPTDVVRKFDGDESVDTAAEIIELLGGQRRPLAHHVVSKHKQRREPPPNSRCQVARLRKSSRVDQFFQYCRCSPLGKRRPLTSTNQDDRPAASEETMKSRLFSEPSP